MKAHVTLGYSSDTGRMRASNQDALCALVQPSVPPAVDALLAVADGMGGHRAGETASRLAIEGLIDRISHYVTGEWVQREAQQYDQYLQQIIHQLDSVIRKSADEPETSGMGTTLTVAILSGTVLSLAHVGDSRLYLWHQGNLRQLTQDHSWVAEQVDLGILTPEEARYHPRRNVLTRALGLHIGKDVDTKIVSVEEGDVVMLCSDGLHSLVTDQKINECLAQRAPQDACDKLVAQANKLGGKDNITLVVARIDELCE